MSNIIYRKAEESDIDSVYNLVCQLENSTLDRKAFEDVFKNNLTDPGVYYMIAEMDGNIIGLGSLHIQRLLHHCGKVAEIQELIVEPSERSKGIGGEMVDWLKSIAEEKECVLIEVSSSKSRELAHRFYEKEGFEKRHYKFTANLI